MLASAPQVAIIVYSLLLWVFKWDIPEFGVIANLFTSNIYIIISILFAAALYCQFGKKGMGLFLKCAFISYFVGSILSILVKFGLKNTIICLLTSVPPVFKMGFIMEVNDLTFAVGVIFLYYQFFAEEEEGRVAKLIVSALLIFWGLKRIEIAALVVCCIAYKLFIQNDTSRRPVKIVGCSILAVCYLYIIAVHSGALEKIAQAFNINFMGRLSTYSFAVNNYSDLSLFFPGIGYGYIDEILVQLESIGAKYGPNNIPIISLHSDILRMYIGLGFIGFGAWIYYQVFTRTKLMKKSFPAKTTSFYLLLTIYSFILFLTDNTYSYPVTCFAINFAILCTLDDSSKSKKTSNIRDK